MVTRIAKPKVLLTCDIPEHIPEYQEFQKYFDVVHLHNPSRQQLIHAFKNELSDIQAIYSGWDGLSNIKHFDEEMIQNSPESLKIISIGSVGHDNYDSKAMRSLRNIHLTNVPSLDSSDGDVADAALYFTLSTFRHFQTFEKSLKESGTTLAAREDLHATDYDYTNGRGGAEKLSGFAFGHISGGKNVNSPRGKNAAIIGFGAIGRAVGDRLSAIGMNIHYTKRTPLPKSQLPKHYIATHHDSLESILPIADVVVLCVPGTPENRHLINEKTIALLPSQGSRIINVGRGSLIDEAALIRGLQNGKVISAGLDVFENEPFVNAELLKRDDVILTPHCGSSTLEVYEFGAVSAMKQIFEALLLNKAPENLVN